MAKPAPATIDDYIAGHSAEVQQRLWAMYQAIRKAAPKATETISYGMPAFKGNKVLVWFAAYKNHTGFYPGAAAIAEFKDELSRFKVSKGAAQFPFDKPLPLALVARIVKFRAKQDSGIAKTPRE